MATNTWIASSAGYWNNPGNWGLGHVPTAGEDVLLNGTGSGKCTLDVNTATLGSFTITVDNTADFDDGGFSIDTNGSFSCTISNFITLTLNGKITIHGDGDFVVSGNDLGDYSDGYYEGLADVDLKGSGLYQVTWYYFDGGLVFIGADHRSLKAAYPGKVTQYFSYTAVYSLHLYGGEFNMDAAWYLAFNIDGNSAFTCDPGTTLTTIQAPTFYFSSYNTSVSTFYFPPLNMPSLEIQFAQGFYTFIETEDLTISFTGNIHVRALNTNTNYPHRSNKFFYTNGHQIDIEEYFLAQNDTNVTGKQVRWYFGSSVINLGHGISSHGNTKPLKLHLESSVWTLLGIDSVGGGTNSIMHISDVTDVYPGTSRIILQPAAPRRLYLGAGTSDPDASFALYDLFVESATGYINAIYGNINVMHEFRWTNSGSYTFSGSFVASGAAVTIKLSSNFNGYLVTNLPGQQITWNTGANTYTIAGYTPGNIGGSISSPVTWKSNTPGTPYRISAPAGVVVGSINVSDCNNTGTVVKAAKAGSVVGTGNTGFTFNSSSTFSSASVLDGKAVLSTIDKDILVAMIQGMGYDAYFDSTSKIKRVIVYYTHSAGRQFQYAIFEGSPMVGEFAWGMSAQNGVWEKNKIVVFDANNAKVTLTNIALESLVHAAGAMTLNTN